MKKPKGYVLPRYKGYAVYGYVEFAAKSGRRVEMLDPKGNLIGVAFSNAKAKAFVDAYIAQGHDYELAFFGYVR